MPAVAAWMLQTLLAAAFRPAWARRVLFRGRGGVCLVHGDNPTTLLAVCLARRVGLHVANLESGLRSHHYLHPFPEEIIRVLVMRRSELLFAPSEWACANLRAMRVRGTIVNLGANTSVEAVQHSLRDAPPSPFGSGYALVTIHRVETLHSRARLRTVLRLVTSLAARGPVVLFLHPPTEAVLRRKGVYRTLAQTPGLRLSPLLPHRDFLAAVKGADFVVNDGGSVQEECYYLGVPCLLMRHRTERLEGLERNVCLSGYDEARIAHFLDHWKDFAAPPVAFATAPSAIVVDAVQAYAEEGTTRVEGRQPQ